MPRISSLATAASTLQAACDLVGEANGLNSLSLSRMKSYSGFGEGVCTCARCMRRAGPIREDVENKLVQITYALANVYDDSPNLDVLVTEEHRARAEDMMACVESGDVTRLRDSFLEIEDMEAEGLLEPGTAPEIATYLIISAAQVGQAEIIRLLAEWDADMEETDSIRRGRPLMHAANNGHTSAVKALVDCGADPEATDDNGYTALMVAVFSDRSSAAEALLDGGAHVDTPDRAGRTALSYAAMYGSTDCIYLLAGRGADVAHVDADGNTPLELAEGSGRQSAVDALKKLQLRVKMQEKRKVKQSRVRGGCQELDAAELLAKEQEAARAAAELLEQLEKEEAAKSATKSSKKKKKGKGKGGAQDHDAADSAQEAVADAVSAAQEHRAQQHTPGKQQQQQRPGVANGSQGWDPQHDNQRGRDDAVKAGLYDGAQHHKQHSKQVLLESQHSGKGSHTVGLHSSHHHHQQQQEQQREAVSSVHAISDHQLAPGTPAAAAVQAALSAAVGSGCVLLGSASDSGGDEAEVLRREWEALLEVAARCKDARQQPQLLSRVSDMLSRCADAGISVKYGRKVLQRLQAVGPARNALQAALAGRSCSLAELETALAAAKSCRCLLEDNLLQRAEDKLVVLQQQHEEEQQRLQQQLLEEQRKLQQQLEEQRVLQLQQQQQQQDEEERRRQQLLREQEQQQQQQQREQEQQRRQELLRKQREQQEQQRKQQQQQAEQDHIKATQEAAQRRAWQQQQANQAATAAAAAASKGGIVSVDDPISPRPPARQQAVPGPGSAVGKAPEPAARQQQQQQLLPQQDPELPAQQLPSRQQQLQHQQQKQPLSPRVPPPLGAQQQVPGMFPQQQQQLQQQSRLALLSSQQSQQQQPVQQALQGLQATSSILQQQQQQQHQQERQLAMQFLEQAAAAQSSALPVPLLPDPLQQQQQHQQQQAAALNQLQMLHQQRMYAAQLQRQVSGGLLGPSATPQGPGLLGSPGLLGGTQQGLQHAASSPGLGPQQLSALQLQRQQRLASSYWAAGGDPLVSPGSFGSVGQPVPGRLSAEMLPPQPPPVVPAASMGLAAGPALHDLARCGSLGPVGVGLQGGGMRGGSGGLAGLAVGPRGAGGLSGSAGAGVLGGSGLPGEGDVLDDHQHPAFSMAHAVLDDDERDVVVSECKLCGEGRANTCCLPCGCLCMCHSCAGRWRQQDVTGLCPFCMRPLEDVAVVS